MSQLSIEQAIDEANSKHYPCEHEFIEGVCRLCFCPKSPKYLDKAWRLMEADKIAKLQNRT